MSQATARPFGSWKSPITSKLITTESVNLGQIVLDGDSVYWVEMRPSEGGRHIIYHRASTGALIAKTPPPFNVRTRVHEYGGGAFAASQGTLYFTNYTDQLLYRLPPGGEPEAITPDALFRYADMIVDNARGELICVREDHTNTDSEAVNALVRLNARGEGEPRILIAGSDFYAYPRLNPSGTMLTWTSWNHPNMPWDGSELWTAQVKVDGNLDNISKIAGGTEESIFQPEWSPDGVLHFISDRSGWWNLYRLSESGIEPILDMEAEFGKPQWSFGTTSYGFQSASSIICSFVQNGRWSLGSVDTASKTLEPIQTAYSEMGRGDLKVLSGTVLFEASSPTEPMSILSLDLGSGNVKILRQSVSLNVDPGYISFPQQIEFPTEDGLTAHAFYYPPRNPDYTSPPGEKPPLLVKSHGGPTGAASIGLNLHVQYWTSRGFAVLDVNYGGSTGYGREYRRRLNGRWGLVDVYDCINAALFLVRQGLAEEDRLAIDGGSAGGYTTLAALTFHDVFKAGASHYGVSDLEALAKDTHKFESRYLDGLIGPYPERKDLYFQRSPINYTDQLSCPLILFQGLEDQIVPPNQAEMMFDAVRKKGLPAAYIAFKGEQHGFRQAENIKKALDAELYFYSKVFGFELAEPVDPVEIENL